ncbi:hypothetical protein M378DRAFT_9942 [Amanita muscaria Koide BX008]|uniref:Uncharacterized protein n=1 Tax=Amanita muscaria (strain Koide BX008) TaxID=946122 RepID=A0A0C2ST51_AMAMK|nr:hypothetical protein M378DRAFT_9942 [Amanita muscaria Koide BX008]
MSLTANQRGNHSCVKVLARLKAEIRAERTNGSEAVRLLVNALETAIKDRANIASPCRVCREVAPAVNIIAERMRDLERVGCSVDRLCYEVLMSLELPPVTHNLSRTQARPSAPQSSDEPTGASIFRSASNVQISEARFTNVNGNSESSIVNNTFVVARDDQSYSFIQN